jgi:hypothetical protein
MKFLCDVNKPGLKTIVIEAKSEKEALEIAIAKWGEENIIIPPHESDCLERIESVEQDW